MATRTVTIHEAEKHLADLIKVAAAGEEVIIEENNQPKARIVPVLPEVRRRVFGQHRGKIRLEDDFDDPLPDAFWFGPQA